MSDPTIDGVDNANPQLAPTLDAYAHHIVGLPSSVRSRAQSGFTVAATAGTAVGIAGVVASDKLDSHPLAIAASIALLLWWVLCGLFFRAVATAAEPLRDVSRKSGEEFIDAVFEKSGSESRRIEGRLTIASMVLAGAALFTFLTVALAMYSSATADGGNVRVELVRHPGRSLKTLCRTDRFSATSAMTGA